MVLIMKIRHVTSPIEKTYVSYQDNEGQPKAKAFDGILDRFQARQLIEADIYGSSSS